MKPFALFLAIGLIGVARTACAEGSLWNGSWTLDPARSSPLAPHMAAPDYAFNVRSDGSIIWRIPAIGEVATGRTDGTPMVVHRTRPTPGLTLAVRAVDPFTFRYQVAQDGAVRGEGLMRLVEGGRAWVDLSWQADRPEDAGALVYVRAPAAKP